MDQSSYQEALLVTGNNADSYVNVQRINLYTHLYISYHLGTHSVDNVLEASTDDRKGEENCFHFIIPGITSYTYKVIVVFVLIAINLT